MLKKEAKKNIKNIDKIVTGVIIGSAVASIFGIKKVSDSRKKKAAIVEEEKQTTLKKEKTTLLSVFGKVLVVPVRLLSRKKKKHDS